MQRRELIAAIAAAAALWHWPASAATERRLGVLMPFSDGDPAAVRFLATLRQALAELGWRDGANLRIDVRWTEADDARSRAYAKELVAKQPDVILAHGPAFAHVQEATRTIPLIFMAIADPVGQGFVHSLSHPGGNITGFLLLEFSVGGKFVELLKEIAPKTKRVAVFADPANTATPHWWRAIEAAARNIGIEPQQVLIRNEVELDAAIDAIAQASNGGIIVPPQAFFTVHRSRLIASVARQRLPVVYGLAFLVRDGGLASYGPDLADQYARAAPYVDRILKGAKPSDLPVPAPTKFEFVINLKTAKALGLEIPPALLGRADEVIE